MAGNGERANDDERYEKSDSGMTAGVGRGRGKLRQQRKREAK